MISRIRINLKIFFSVLFFIAIIHCVAQTNPIKVELKSLTSKGNFYYSNWPNQFKLSAEGISRKQLIVSVNHGTLTQVNDSIYSLFVTGDSSKINFIFSYKLKGKIIQLELKRRTIKQITPIGIAIDGKLTGEKVQFYKSDFKVGSRFTLVFQSDLYKDTSSVKRFEFTMIANDGKVHVQEGNGGELTEEVKKFIFDCSVSGKSVHMDAKSLSGHSISDKFNIK